MPALHDPNTIPWFRRSTFADEEREAAGLSDKSELLYHRFLREFYKRRCDMSADPRIVARYLGCQPREARTFLDEAQEFITVKDGRLFHKGSRESLDKAVSESIKQANKRAKVKVVPHG